MLKIGPHEHPSRVIIAPMAGVTDQPYRNMCRQFGAHWMVSEMITSDRSLWDSPKSRQRLAYHNEAGPRWIQIAGAEPEMMADAARFNADRGADIIDINMGCPAKKVCNRQAGSALLRDEKLVGQILDAVVAAVDVPVTLKIRLGWCKETQNALAIGRIAEAAGVQLLTVHGRTRACKFAGQVDYNAIAEVVAGVTIPVVANGDIKTPDEAQNVLHQTAAAAVMMGRATQGHPWLAAAVDHYLATGKEKIYPGQGEIKQALVAHVQNLAGFYGEVMGVRIARKHVGWYLAERASAEFMKKFNGLQTSIDQVEAILETFAKELAA
jgi:tRNA-dihydrouridine synthase B